jgi:hypothetical protein
MDAPVSSSHVLQACRLHCVTHVILEETPDLASLEILRRVREAGYQGGKTALYDLVLRFVPSQPSHWCVSKAFPESSASTISVKSKWSS